MNDIYHMNYVWLEQLCSKQHSRYFKKTQQLDYGLLKNIFNMSYCLKRAHSFYCKEEKCEKIIKSSLNSWKYLG